MGSASAAPAFHEAVHGGLATCLAQKTPDIPKSWGAEQKNPQLPP